MKKINKLRGTVVLGTDLGCHMFNLVSQTGLAKCIPGKGVHMCSFCNLTSQVLAMGLPSTSTKLLPLSSRAITPAQLVEVAQWRALVVPSFGIPIAQSWEEQGWATYKIQEICLKTTATFNSNFQALAPVKLRTGAGCSACSGGRTTPAMSHFQSCQWQMEERTSSWAGDG